MNMEKIKKGTTTIGLVCQDGVILGADKRATMDTFIASKEVKKIYKISDNLGVTIAGGVGDALELIRLLRYHSEIYRFNTNLSMSPKVASTLLANILQSNKYFPFLVQMLIGGINERGEPELYNIDPLGGYTKENFTATGSGSLTAIGILEEAYKANRTTDENLKIGIKALNIAMRRDAATGDGIDIVKITKEGYFEYSKEEIEKLLKE
ncbi:MAG: archaeal proteasome endopeptidase complex subunit beta [Candidatus Micrarchaeia archaeon]|jgi:proteasome beta subunit